ncbi:hypothetical protein CJJ07_003736 [Candidozyma auris]|nr:hypothetical protein CJJ07_003736 [[Candida] auris]QEL61363.1 hypothetical protein CJJ09_003504 [[Candida] auris]
MNLETRLTGTLNDVLRTSGYIFEIINNNKRQSNLITGPNNQLIPPPITAQLAASVAQFDSILDDTVSKFNDARWCVEQIVENKQKQEELRIQEEIERKKRLEEQRRREEEEKKRREEEEARRKEEEERREKEAKEQEERARQERERLEREKQEKERKELEEKQRREEQERNNSNNNNNDLDMMDTGLDFDMDLDKGVPGIPNPSDILSSISYKGPGGDKADKNKDPMDLGLNSILGEGQDFDDLNMDLLGQEFDAGGVNPDEEFDVDNFLNQFGND